MRIGTLTGVALAALALGGCATGSGEAVQASGSASAVDGRPAGPIGLGVSPQPARESVIVTHALIPEPGFVVIHETDAAGDVVVPGSLGSAPLSAGDNRGVRVTLDRATRAGETLVAMLHRDTDGDGAYEFGPGSTGVDTPLLLNGTEPVVAAFTITEPAPDKDGSPANPGLRVGG